MIAGCMSEKECGTPILVGLLQIILTPVFLIGYIWSICWGVQLWKKGGKQGDYVASNNAKPGDVEAPPPPPPAAQGHWARFFDPLLFYIFTFSAFPTAFLYCCAIPVFLFFRQTDLLDLTTAAGVRFFRSSFLQRGIVNSPRPCFYAWLCRTPSNTRAILD